MPVRRRRTKRTTVRKTARRTTLKRRVRRKKGVSARRKVAKAMMITPTQRRRLRGAMRDIERNINALTRRYNQLLNQFSRF
jgi:prefoldin subunit 5